jgi:hypothetical protein
MFPGQRIFQPILAEKIIYFMRLRISLEMHFLISFIYIVKTSLSRGMVVVGKRQILKIF